MASVRRYAVRVWIPDRPGALGSVASRIGAVRGDLVGIDILERGGGRAIDELVIELPDEDLVPLLLNEMGQVDGVDVEDIHEIHEWGHDQRVDALETAAVLVAAGDRVALIGGLVAHAVNDFDADWAVVVEPDADRPSAAMGQPPAMPWLSAYAAGSLAAPSPAEGDAGEDDVACTAVGSAGAALVLGRRGRAFRARERRQLAALAKIAGLRWAQLG